MNSCSIKFKFGINVNLNCINIPYKFQIDWINRKGVVS